MATKILDDLCDCRPSVSEHLMQLGVQHGQAEIITEFIKEEIEKQQDNITEPIKEQQIMKKILNRTPLDEVMAAKVCQVVRNAYRDYWYKKTTLEKSLKMKPEEPWETAARRTLELYKRTKPSLSELTRATQKIQAAYKGYYVRRNLLQHLKKKKKRGPKLDLPGPTMDIAASREIDLGPLISIEVPKDDVHAMFDEGPPDTLSISYEPMTAITHVPEEDHLQELPSLQEQASKVESRQSRLPSLMSSQISEGMRQSQLSQPSKTESRKSRIDSQIAPSSTGPKISFAGVRPEVVPDEEAYGEEVGEVTPPETTEISEVGEYGEDFEEGGVQEDMEDVPEDITDHSEYEESIPASLPSSAPVTANTTDVEDEGEMEDATN